MKKLLFLLITYNLFALDASFLNSSVVEKGVITSNKQIIDSVISEYKKELESANVQDYINEINKTSNSQKSVTQTQPIQQQIKPRLQQSPQNQYKQIQVNKNNNENVNKIDNKNKKEIIVSD